MKEHSLKKIVTSKSIMPEPITVNVGNIDLGSIAKQIDAKAEFGSAVWEEHLEATIKGIRELMPDIVHVLQQLQPEIGRRTDMLGQDGPTDVIWIMSLLFIIRTIGILGSKSTDGRRSMENRKEHAKLLERYLKDVNEIISQKENCVALFSEW